MATSYWGADSVGAANFLTDKSVSMPVGWAGGHRLSLCAFALFTSTVGAPVQAPRATSVSPTIAGLDFTSANRGWVAVYSPRPSGTRQPCDYDPAQATVSILATRNAGKSWTDQLHFTGTSTVDQNDRLPGTWLRFLSARVGFVVGPDGRGRATLFRTLDGGGTWRPLRLPGAPGGFVGDPLSFSSAYNGWLLADVGGAAGQSSARIFHTMDAGAHWKEVAIANPGSGVGNLGSAGDKNAIAFRNQSLGWVTAISAAGPGLVYATRDGGGHWSLQNLALSNPRLPARFLRSAGFPSAPLFFGRSTGLLVTMVSALLARSPRSGRTGTPTYYLYVYKLAADGTHWVQPQRLPGAGSVTQPMSWQFIGPERWWVVAGRFLYRTANAGQTWHVSSLHLPDGFTIATLDFVGPSQGWAIATQSSGRPYTNCNSALLRTMDGGAHWRTVAVP